MLMASAAMHAQADKVKFAAIIKNPNSDSLMVVSRSFKKVLKATKPGTFTDSFAVADGMYTIFDGTEQTPVYLKNGYDLTLTLDAKQFDETVTYKGKGEKENNFIAGLNLGMEQLQTKLAAASPQEQSAVVSTWADAQAGKLTDPALDANFVTMMKQELAGIKEQLAAQAAQAAAAAKLKGNPSPEFVYENHKGGKTKLSELKGKYVYVDVWATWCGPCRQEIPHLQKVEEQFHDKKIAFVSISIDTSKDHEKWKKFVTDKSLGGIQLFADKDWKSDFIQAYGINSIPRFILIDPQGKVVDADAKRPSDPALTEELQALLK